MTEIIKVLWTTHRPIKDAVMFGFWVGIVTWDLRWGVLAVLGMYMILSAIALGRSYQ